MTWNPQDGGTFEQLVRRLTVDTKGRRGDQPGFDKDNVAVYGLGFSGSGETDGQTSWSWYAASTGWKYSEGEPWTRFFYDEPKFVETISWYRSLITKGYMPTLAQATTLGDATPRFGAGKYAITPNGSWMLETYAGFKAGEDEAGQAPDRPAADGWDVTPFLEPVEAGDVFPYPANPNAADVSAVRKPAMDSIMAFESEPAAGLAKANEEVNQILAATS